MKFYIGDDSYLFKYYINNHFVP